MGTNWCPSPATCHFPSSPRHYQTLLLTNTLQIQTNIYKNIDKYMEIKIYLNKNAKRIHKYKALSGQPSPRHHHILLLTNTYIKRHKYSITNTQILMLVMPIFHANTPAHPHLTHHHTAYNLF